MSIRMTKSTLLGVPHCPRCNRSNPAFMIIAPPITVPLASQGLAGHYYHVGSYRCTSCDRIVLAESKVSQTNMEQNVEVENLLPDSQSIHTAINGRSRQFLEDALASLNAPSASIMASCSSIDAMLKDRGVGRFNENKTGKERSLAKRINIAVEKQVLTKDMADWAHKVRLDANDQRHADEDAELPDKQKALNIFELAVGLGEVLFVLPEKAKLQEVDDDGEGSE